jgi:deazaflavin-dependent oxidoreductase (nitroreductase family)
MPNQDALVPELDPLREKSANERFGDWLAQKRPVSWFILKIASKIDPILMQLSGGRVNMTGTNAVVILHHVGAKTGLARQTPLLYFTEGRNVVLVAGNGGLPRHPAWLHNVRANPDVELWVGKHGGPYRARVASAEQRAVLWPKAIALYSGYDHYQELAGDREIQLVICAPRDS